MANFSDYTLNNNVHMWKVLAAWKGKTDHTSSKRCATLCLGANQERCSGTELFSLCLIHISAPFIVICFLASFVLVFILQVLMLMYFIKLSMLHNGYWSSYWFKFIYTKCVKCFPKRGWTHPDLYNNHWLMNPPLDPSYVNLSHVAMLKIWHGSIIPGSTWIIYATIFQEIPHWRGLTMWTGLTRHMQ